MAINVSGWLAGLLGIDTVREVGVDVTPRSKLNFSTGLEVTDNEADDSIDVTLAAATTSSPGSLSAADKTKLDGLQKQGASVAIAALSIDWSLASVFTKTLAAGANTFTFANATDGQVVVVVLTGAASTVTWPTVQWAGGTPPTQTASGTDVYTFVKAGTTIYGSVVQDMS